MKSFNKGRHWRLLIILAIIIASTMIITACGNSDNGGNTDKDKVKVTMFIWAGANQGVVPAEVVEAYMDDHPNVEISLYESNNAVTYPKMVAAKKTTPDQPLVHFGFFNVDATTQGDIDDMWESLDPERIPNMKLVDEKFWRADNKGIGQCITPIGIIYNKDKVTEPPTSWTDLWNPKYKGKVTLWDYKWYALVIAALLNGGDENNIDPGFNVWSEHADQIHSLYNSNDQLKNLLVSGDAYISHWFASIYKTWADEGAPLGFAIPKEGVVAFPAYLQIVKGCTPEQKKVAEDIINILLSPEANGRYAELTNNLPTVKGAKLSEAVANDPIFAPEVVDNAINYDWSTIAKKNNEWKDRWDKEVKAKM